ncbi:MAG: DNA-processing protein DprA [Saprospiraceae bacterium]|nr:DNA-processing protein DprA [Saprospiraceae bacterium]
MSEGKKLYEIALTKIPMIGAITAKTLVSYCGSAKSVFKSSKKQLAKIPGIGHQLLHNIMLPENLKEAERELNFIEKEGISTHFYLDKSYPTRLKHYPESPILLYFKGNIELEADRLVGVVGTRKPSPYGVNVCEELVNGLLPYQPIVVSGLAYGIDITAHKKALEIGLPTIAVLGHGLNQVYPLSHKSIAQQMVTQGGLLSEFGSDMKINRENFPMRNRVIAGICDVVIVVESGLKGGSVITAHMANNYNKDVFAVPGRLSDKHAQGCNHLIKTHKAALIESAEDVAYIMRWDKDREAQSRQIKLFEELSEVEQAIVDLLKEEETIHLDKLALSLNQKTSTVSSLLLEMEFKGLVKTLPGKTYMLAGW